MAFINQAVSGDDKNSFLPTCTSLLAGSKKWLVEREREREREREKREREREREGGGGKFLLKVAGKFLSQFWVADLKYLKKCF